MNEREYFDTLVKIFELVWKDDDLMEQDTLFTLQDLVGDALLKSSNEEWNTELVEKFPWAFEKVQ